MTWRDVLPAPAKHLLLLCEVAAGRLGRDDGEIGIVGAVILAAGLAIAATILVTAITGKLQNWISQIPG